MNRTNAADSDESFLTITGPTAVGKTDVSLALAEELDAEIISADSRQVYEELTIGTAKPSVDVRQEVTHHFIDERSVFNPPYSAGAFARDANTRIGEILNRGKQPIVVGGSTLYIHALQFGLADVPSVDDSVRAHIEDRLEHEGAEALYAELKEVDPQQASTMDPTKTQRLVRALEVYHGTGRPLSYYHEQQPEPPYTFRTIVLNRDRERLYRRIEKRVDRMLERGLLEEVESLLDAGVDPARQPLRTIGYREPIQHLRGEVDYDEMVRLVKRNSRRYAKRQLTWFRRYDDYEWVAADEVTADNFLSYFSLQ
jgi:tRNA dimethylallyltransferase